LTVANKSKVERARRSIRRHHVAGRDVFQHV
jgi:hypothetical protein